MKKIWNLIEGDTQLNRYVIKANIQGISSYIAITKQLQCFTFSIIVKKLKPLFSFLK